MADLKISALTASTTPLAGTEVLPIVQSSTTKQVSVANLTAGRAVSVASVTITGGSSAAGVISKDATTGLVIRGIAGSGYDFELANSGGSTAMTVATGGFKTKFWDNVSTLGNVVIETSGKGIDFSATPGTGTSELLADYEEGSWTPTITAGSGSYTTVTSQAGTYTKVGRQVTLKWYFIVTNKGTGAGSVNISNLPFASNASVGNYYAGSGYDTSQGIGQTTTMTATTSIDSYKYDGTDPIVVSRAQVGQITYFV